MRSRVIVAGLIFAVVVCAQRATFASSLSLAALDDQQKIGTGAMLLSGGASLIVALGTFGVGGLLFGSAAAGFQVGFSVGIVAKSTSSVITPDPNFAQAVQVGLLTIDPLPASNLVDPNLAGPANATLQDIATFDANIRAFGIARNRYVSALAAGDATAAQSQLTAASGFFQTAQGALSAVSNDLAQLDLALASTALGNLPLDVAGLFSSVQSTLLAGGFPPEEQTFLNQFQMTPAEQARFISSMAALTAEDAVATYGSFIAFHNLLGEMGRLSGNLATGLPAETNFVPVPEPASLVLVGAGIVVVVRRLRSSP